MIENLNSLSIEQKIGQLFFIGIARPEVDDATRSLLTEISPGGICLFARNIKEAEQTRRLTDDLVKILSEKTIISIDQEGGLVDRLRRIMTPMPAASKLVLSDDASALGGIIGEVLRILGINMDFAPVVDVMNADREAYSNGLFSRCYGNSSEDAAIFAGNFLRALQTGGITGCLKHFPGLSAARIDSHEELPVVEIQESELNDVDLFPYREILASGEVRTVMVAHASFPRHPLQEVAQNGTLLPSSLSYNFVTKLLRDELGYDGLVVTDDLEMGAIINNYGVGDACTMAILAGVDMLAICANPERIQDGYNAVLKAVNDGTISLDRLNVTLNRIAKVKSQLSEPLEFSADRLEYLSDEVARLNQRLAQ